MKAPQRDQWTGPMDGPWPQIWVKGELERAETEWLSTNNIGAYAMSTVALMHTRRQHGLLVSHLAEDFRRHVVLSHLEMALEVAGRTHRLSTHQFPNMAPTLGYRALESFAQDPLPRWTYRFPTGTIERTLCLVPNRQALVIAMTWTGNQDARLTLRPLMPMRPANELTHEHGGMLQKVTLRAGEVEVQPVAHLPPVTFQHSGVFMGFPDWWRKFEYLDDRGRYDDFQEDMWSPGLFEIEMGPRSTTYLIVSVGAPPEGSGQELIMEAAQRRLSVDPASADPSRWEDASAAASTARSLSVAAESFVFGDGTAIVAGFPWLDVWARDTLLSVPGLYLARGEVERARTSLRHLLRTMKFGFLLSRTTAPEAECRPCVESSLWLAPIGAQVVAESEFEPDFVTEWYEALAVVFTRIVHSQGELAWLTSDGLLANGASFPMTWMDAEVRGEIPTPRWGLAVEFQALWIAFCEIFADAAEDRDDVEMAERARGYGERCRDAFHQNFWCHETNHPFDCISEERASADTWADPSVRPNALIALAVEPDLFEPWQAAEILTRAEELLLRDAGVRTLEPGHPAYVGRAGDSVEERQAASHQGAAWTHLLRFYVAAKFRHAPESRDSLIERVVDCAGRCRALGFNGQCVDGDGPPRQIGIPAYAMSTAMLLEVLVRDLDAAEI